MSNQMIPLTEERKEDMINEEPGGLWLVLEEEYPRNHVTGLTFMILFTLVFYAIFARFREQACTFICPYGRLQSTMLDENTMVVATGEFGRTPRINPAGGRDHWPACWSMLMAGGGIRGGQVVGESDETASAPRNRPITPPEVAATVYHALGVDLVTELPGPQQTPIRIVDEGVEPVRELFV